MKATVVPNRNKIFSSIIQAAALSISEQTGELCAIAMGIHAGDFSIYPDCRQEFRDADFEAFKVGNWGAEKVYMLTPYLHGHKLDILKDGEKCCEYLHLILIKYILKQTHHTNQSNIQFIIMKMKTEKPNHLKNGFQTYKSGSSIERVEAFINLGRKDSVQYADEYGPVTWEYVVEYVKQVLAENGK
jgi:7-cyano-7-deazaguanine synthase